MGSPALVTKVQKDDWVNLNRVLRKLAFSVVGPDASPTFAGLTLTGDLDLNDNNIVNCGNITGTDVDISAGTGTVTAGVITDGTASLTGGVMTGLTIGNGWAWTGASAADWTDDSKIINLAEDGVNLRHDNKDYINIDPLGINMNFGNTTDNPTSEFLGTGLFTTGGNLTFGNGAVTDSILTFNGSGTNGTLTYESDNELFIFSESASILDDLGIGGDLTVTGDTVTDELTITAPTQDYLFTGRQASILLESQTSGEITLLEIKSKDSDGSDITGYRMYKAGDGETTYDLLDIWANPDGEGVIDGVFLFRTLAQGYDLSPIVMQTGSNNNQFRLNIDGTINMLDDLDIGGDLTVLGSTVLGDNAADTHAVKGTTQIGNPGTSYTGINATGHIVLSAGTAAAGTAPLKFATGTLTTTPEIGTIEFDSTHFHITSAGGARRVISRGSDSIVTSETVANTTTETTVHTATLPAGSLIAGKVYEVKGYGKASTFNAASTLTIRVKINGTVLATLDSTPGIAANEPMHFNTAFTIRTIGATGTISAHGVIAVGSDSGHTNTSSVVVDTTAINEVTLTMQWDIANAGNTATLDQAYMKLNN